MPSRLRVPTPVLPAMAVLGLLSAAAAVQAEQAGQKGLTGQGGAAERTWPRRIPIDDRLDLIRLDPKQPDYRRAYAQAGRLLGRWTLDLAGTGVDGPLLVRLARSRRGEPFTRVLREGLKRPVDPHDLLLLLDDVLRAGRAGLYGRRVFLLPGRVRKVGALVHPQEVFRLESRGPRSYPHHRQQLAVDRPERRPDMPPAADGAVLGPNWVMRYKNPRGRERKLRALAEQNPSGTFAARVRTLIEQLEAQGAEVGLYTTVRRRRRGYLMWGAFALSRKKNRAAVIRFVRELERVNQEWELDVPIRWFHPGGWRATVEAARRMADAYDVVYATRSGALRSNHYDAQAVDFSALALPRRLTLAAPDGRRRSFDLRGAEQSRDLNLSPELIDWVERHFRMRKLELDYPHWDDTAPPNEKLRAQAAAAADRPLPELPAPPAIAVAAPATPPPLAPGWFSRWFPAAPLLAVALGGLLVLIGRRRGPQSAPPARK